MSDIKYITIPILPVDAESEAVIDKLLAESSRKARRPLLRKPGKTLIQLRDQALQQAFDSATDGWADQQACPDPGSIEAVRNAWAQALSSPLPDYVFSRAELRELLLNALSEAETPPRSTPSDFVDAFIRKLSDADR